MSDRDVDTIREAREVTHCPFCGSHLLMGVWGDSALSSCYACKEQFPRVLAASAARPAADEALREALTHALRIADRLFDMVPRQVWRDTGGDDGQGHYEGDYHAWKVAEQLAELRAALSGPPGTAREDARDAVIEAAERLWQFLENEKETREPPADLVDLGYAALETSADYEREEKLSIALGEALAALRAAGEQDTG